MDTRTEQTTTRSPSPSGDADACEHGWMTESRHRVSTGTVAYVRCARCGRRRVDHLGEDARVPTALSRSVG
ncbi:hypothetical protein [Brevibacterium casei]|uniref:hypothetical protein n=1 Tax=Brevibacterium casei TaxID=33889 RepID=UPI0024690E5D|nr:hypothetical protein [Brevibacterium casei]